MVGACRRGVVLTLPAAVHIYVAAEPVDLRRGFDGLAAATRSLIRLDPLSGHVFAFLNRRFTATRTRAGAARTA